MQGQAGKRAKAGEGGKMNIKEFADKHRLKVKRDECNDPIIPGRFGHIYEHDEKGQLGVYFEFSTARRWNFARQALVDRKLILRQDAQTEGTMLFDSSNLSQVSAICRFARLKTRRMLSEAQKRALEKARQSSPLNACVRSRAPEVRPAITDADKQDSES